MNLYLTLFFYLLNSKKIIKNMNYPSCRNCKFFAPNYYLNFNSPFNNCEKFGEKNIFTGDIDYESASSCRRDETKCGEFGLYFELEPNIKLNVHIMCENIELINNIIDFLMKAITIGQLIGTQGTSRSIYKVDYQG